MVREDPSPANRDVAAQAVQKHREAYSRWVGTREGQAWAKKQATQAAQEGDPVKAAIIQQHANKNSNSRALPSQANPQRSGSDRPENEPAGQSADGRVGSTRPTVTLQPVKSSAIRAVGYDKETGRCEVEMRTRPGQPYAYRMTPKEYHKFRAAPSLGAHFARNIARNPKVAYPDRESWEADATQRRCGQCGRWAGSNHVCATPTVVEGTQARQKTEQKTDRTDTATIRTRTGLDQAAWQGQLTVGQFSVPVDATTNPTRDEPKSYRVTGVVTGTYENNQWDVTAGPGELSCSCGQEGCTHRQEVTAAIAQTVNPAAAPEHAQEALTGARNAAAVEYYKAEERHANLPDRDAPEIMYSNDPDAFEQDAATARAHNETGSSPIRYMRENALGGMSDRDGGRGFGVELEFDLPADWDDDRQQQVREAIAADLHAQGLTGQSTVREWTEHPDTYPTSHQGGWAVTTDASCSGEVVSPIMYDEPDTWANLEKVCQTIQNHGGTTSRWTGGHVHVSTFDYDHTVENHTRLTQMWRDHQDTMFRLGSTPGEGHRGFGYCMPNKIPTNGFTTWESLNEYSNVDRDAPINFAPTVRPDTQNGHVEFRAWDGSLDPATIQTRIKVSVAMTDAAFRDREYTSTGPEPVGMHAIQHPVTEDDANLTGPNRNRETRSVRRVADLLFTRAEDKAQVAGLFAVNTWVDTRPRVSRTGRVDTAI